MKKSENNKEVNEMKKVYDFSSGIQGKHYKAYRKGHTVRINKKDGSIMLDPDVKKHFPDSESVNKVLREYIATH